MLSNQKLTRLAAIAASLLILCLGCAYFYLATSLERQLTAELSRQLNHKSGHEIQNLFKSELTNRRLISQINQDLTRAHFTNTYLPVTDIRVQLRRTPDSWQNEAPLNQPAVIELKSSQAPFLLDFHFQINWLQLIAYCLLSAGLATFAIFYLPEPVKSSTKQVARRIAQRHADYPKALIYQHARQYESWQPMQQQVFQFLSEQKDCPLALTELISWCHQKPEMGQWRQSDFAWFCCAFRHAPEAPDLAVKVGSAPDLLEFYTETQQIKVHGIEIHMAKTPFLYYLWYASQKLSSDGWVLNPATNQPSQTLANALIELMQTHNGHAKAINDLKSYGLKAKTIDQNRNKIKSELSQILGEQLADLFLFESRRDSKTQRYWYRLKCPGKQIIIH